MERKSKAQLCKELGIPTYETRISYSDFFDRLDIFYHDTAIASIWGYGKLKIDNGGWWSKTTKKRINAVLSAFGLPYSIYQANWQWYLSDREGITYPFKNETNYNGYHFTATFDTNTKELLPQGE